MNIGGVPLAGGRIDRDVPTRMSPEALREARNDPSARLLRLRGSMIPVRETPGNARKGGVELSLIPCGESQTDACSEVFLGRLDGAPVFAVLEEEPSEVAAASDAHATATP